MMASTKETILQTLHAQGKCTIKELAEAVGISPISVRHHVANLQAEGLLAVEEHRHGVGRPHHLYRLSEKGFERFPRRYYQLSTQIIEEIKDTLSEEEIRDFFVSIASHMADKYLPDEEELPFDQRINALEQILSEAGFEAHVEHQDDQLLIHELCCPFYPIGLEHPEICLIDQHFIANALGIPCKRVKHVRKEDRICTFMIRLNPEERKSVVHAFQQSL